MISQYQLDKLRGAQVRVTSSAKELSSLTGTLRVVDHEIPAKGQTFNLDVALPSGKSITLQLTGGEAKQLLESADNAEPVFKWNGKPRTLRPVSIEDMLPPTQQPALSMAR